MNPHTRAVCVLIAGLIQLSPALTVDAAAQTSRCATGQELIAIPEIRSQNGLLQAELTLASGRRTIWSDTRCVRQDIRYLTGRDLQTGAPADTLFASDLLLPGPTFRAHVGDLIQIRFLNQVDTRNFALSLDRESTDFTNTTGCDEVFKPSGELQYPSQGDVPPNCLHGSSTSNVHFHGTHTTPNTTGDNIMLFVRPAPRDAAGTVTLDSALVNSAFSEIWRTCAASGSPTAWGDLPERWRAEQERLLKEYDSTAPFRGVDGALPTSMKLWPANETQIDNGIWPQYQIGAFPYCFRLANPANNTMGQAPGTHWYHAHKHGSTALNVANGLTGMLVIEGQYDDDLERFYPQLREQVLMIQQLSTNPFPVTNPARSGKATRMPARLAVNGRLDPVVTMRPGEVQLWRMANGAYRDAFQLREFVPLDGAAPGGMAWRQIAQDGVQLAYANYQTLGALNRMVNLAPANRADLLVKAPLQTGRYALTVQPNLGLALDPISAVPPVPLDTLLIVSVEGTAVSPAQDFIQDEADFPTLPAYLADITEAEIDLWRKVRFGSGHNTIDGEKFDQNVYSQTMTLNNSEEWTVSNLAGDKSHPFHIHINPFQITEVFQPNLENTSDPNAPCYVNPRDPLTWKPCGGALTGPYVWWDTFAIPAGAPIGLPDDVCTEEGECPAPIQRYTSCSDGVCTVTIPGHFKMRSRFVDFTGSYVIHCHILIHEDRGMMQLVRVVPEKPPYSHR